MTALGVVLPGQSVDVCRYCSAPATSIRLRFYVRNGSGLKVGEAWSERHDCPVLGRTVLSDLVDAEVFGPDEHEEGGIG